MLPCLAFKIQSLGLVWQTLTEPAPQPMLESFIRKVPHGTAGAAARLKWPGMLLGGGGMEEIGQICGDLPMNGMKTGVQG